jgi:hypothetical protein
VGRREEINPECDSSKLCFHVFYSMANTPTKKKTQQETPYWSPLFWYRPSKSKFWRKYSNFLSTEESNLEANISGSVQVLFSIYILI